MRRLLSLGVLLFGLLWIVACSSESDASDGSAEDVGAELALDAAASSETPGGVWTPPLTDAQGPTDTEEDSAAAEDVSATTDAAEVAGPDLPEEVAEEEITPSPDVAPDVPEPTPDVGPGPDPPVEPPPVDCDAIPQGPFTLEKLNGSMASEDLAFDAEGHVIGSNDQAIFKSGYNESPQVWIPNFKFRAGLRFLPNGHLIVCNDKTGQLIRIDTEGVQHVLVNGLSYPNGLTVDLEGWIYFTEHDANQVWRVHPFTGEKTLLTTQIGNPNGVTFSPDYKTLYIGGFNGEGTVYAMSISPSGTPGKLVPFATNVGSGWLDGMATDACGNVYICDYGQTVIYRISPDGQTKTKIIDGSNIQGAYLPNLQWGSGIGGWDPLAVYIPDGWNKGVFEVVLGVPGKERPYP